MAVELPQSLEDALPTIVADIPALARGNLVPHAEARTQRIARAAMVKCYEYAPGAPEELLIEAATRLGGWFFGDADARRL